MLRLGNSKAPAIASDIRCTSGAGDVVRWQRACLAQCIPRSCTNPRPNDILHSLGRELSILFLWLFGCVVAFWGLALLRSAPEGSPVLSRYSDTQRRNFDIAHHRKYLRLVVLLYLPVLPLMLGTVIFASQVGNRPFTYGLHHFHPSTQVIHPFLGIPSCSWRVGRRALPVLAWFQRFFSAVSCCCPCFCICSWHWLVFDKKCVQIYLVYMPIILLL